MNFKKILTGVVAGAMAVSAMAVSSFASLYEGSIAENGGPENNCYKLAGVEGVDYSKVAKVEAVVDTDSYVNGCIGVSSNGKWTNSTPENSESNGGPATWVLDGLSGIDANDENGSLKEDVVQVQFWWLNAGTFSLESVTLYDADGNVLQAEPEVTEPDVTESDGTEAPDETEGPAPDVDEFTEVAISGNEKHDAPVLNVDGKVRLNIVHPWSQGEYVFADYKAFTGATVIKAEITVSGVTDAFNAQLMGSNNSDPVSFSIWGDSETDVGTSDVVTIDKDGKYVLTLTSPEAIVESENFFLMINTTLDGVKNGDDSVPPEGLTVTLDKLSVNVKQTDEPVGTGSEGTEPDVTDPEETLVADGTETEGTDAEATTSGVAGNTNNGGNDKGDNKPTGIVFAVIPAVAAAAAVVISKKRK